MFAEHLLLVLTVIAAGAGGPGLAFASTERGEAARAATREAARAEAERVAAAAAEGEGVAEVEAAEAAAAEPRGGGGNPDRVEAKAGEARAPDRGGGQAAKAGEARAPDRGVEAGKGGGEEAGKGGGVEAGKAAGVEDGVAADREAADRRAGGGHPGRPRGPGRGFPATGPWVSYYGPAHKVKPLRRLADRFRILNIDADPGVGAWTPAEIRELKAGGRNRVISYLNVGSCEQFREYFSKVPPGFVPCKQNLRAQKGRYSGYPDEIWMDPSNPDYAKLIVDHVALRLVRAGVDGFFLDNMEIVEHGDKTSNGPCGDRCRQGGLELMAALRRAYPEHLIVMQNATSDVTRLGVTELGPLPQLLDGIAHESVFAPERDDQALGELRAWNGMKLKPGGRPFFIGVEDYVGTCRNLRKARFTYQENRRNGFSPYATDASAGQQQICYWPF
jgi:cysteinyl-tRNA synthetase, unknown class